jgi:excisionase family DNA binding protein
MKPIGETRVTPKEAASLLGVPVDRVRKWCESGELASYRSVYKWRLIERSELIAFAKRHPERVSPTAK